MSPLLLENTSAPIRQPSQTCKGYSDSKGSQDWALEISAAELEASRARKRRKVKMSPNSKFTNIKAIRKAQIEAGEIEDNTDESSESENPSDGEILSFLGRPTCGGVPDVGVGRYSVNSIRDS
ncbi:uncharacterized protein BCR38DRAFT_438437 [Pseudomassariella vexata]|uniref:Uncharacterized protein n=1 Tax=Pseudomassariella vexata TaxID=1141098 RepID=A0A1Y2DTG1_9PEZI|nr:uncharacterized protein BCR38DRAFT_438437 [Pseudomassariella vexata]ORY62426.1 hypothetical protein BCR38DRAFT_438437 [Pseudomassariella vexata]